MRNASFIRKVVYLGLMAALLVPLYLVSAPSFVNEDGSLTEGGWLTQMRDDHELAQANLGEIDPASESMKLATLGMRGIAANLLWNRANEFKKKEEWDNLRATLNQIAKLQPNFISVWSFQAWNLTYNVSVEFDNYEHRYHWVKKGIEFLMQGIRYNTNEPRLLWDLGWFFGHKVGRSDEYLQFRRKYNADEDFHEALADKIAIGETLDYKNQPDNWLTAYQWFSQAQDAVDIEGATIVGKNPLVFHSDAAKALIRYADAIELEGQFSDFARIAWFRAHERWKKYGNRDIPTSYGYMIRLSEQDRWNQLVADREKQLEALIPGLQEKLRQEKIDKLTPQERALIDVDRAGLEADQYEIAVSAEEKIKVTPEELIAAAQQKREVRRLTNNIATAKAYATTIRRYRDIVNFHYWETRCIVEQEDRALEGRRFLWEADELYEEGDLVGAKQKYDEGWIRWASIHKDHTVLAEDVTAEDLVDAIKKYRKVLSQLDEEFPPPNFPMLRLVANYAEEFDMTDEEANALRSEADRLEAEAVRQQNEAGAPESQTSDQDPQSNPETSDANREAEPDPSAGPVANPDDAGEADPAPEIELSAETRQAARDTLASASATYESADLAKAREQYEDAFGLWQAELGGSELSDDDRRTLIKQIRSYRILIGQLDEAFPPEGFALLDFVKATREDFGYTADDVESFGK